VVHDFAFVTGGAEWVTRVLSTDLLRGAQTVVLTGNPGVAAALNPQTAVRRLLPPTFDRRTYRFGVPVYPRLLGRMAPIEGDVLASSYAFAHHVRATGRKVVYCHSPLRQAWSGARTYAGSGPVVERWGIRVLGAPLRKADLRAQASAHAYVATSRAVQSRIREFYRRDEVELVPPPVDDRVYRPRDTQREDFYLFVGRITEPYKRLGLLVETFRAMPGRRLVVVGEGRDRRRLEAVAPPNVEFRGWLSADDVADFYARTRGLLFPSEDDFGLVPAEAMSCGAPVLAFRAGGALDTVDPEVSGVFFDRHEPAAVAAALTEFESRSWSDTAITDYARRFGRARFVDTMRGVLARLPER
jgi:glycosyltransferase involved in cell wall biosynthesis